MKFDSVVFADSASRAALSCFARLSAQRDAGRRSLVVPLLNDAGADAIIARGLAGVLPFSDLEGDGAGPFGALPGRERLSVVIRRLAPTHVMAPLGLMGAPQAIDYFSTLRAALSVDTGRDLLFFEERPHGLIADSVPLRLAAIGARLPPASRLRPPGRHLPLALRLVTGLGVPPVFGRIGERSRLALRLKRAFREAADWDAHRALGPKLQPVTELWREEYLNDIFALATELGQEIGSKKSFRRGLARHAAGAGSRNLMERYWLSLPGADSLEDSFGGL